MTFDKGLLSPTDLRILSGVDERKELKTAMLITNLGNAPYKIIGSRLSDLDMPEYASLPDPEKSYLQVRESYSLCQTSLPSIISSLTI